MAAESSKFVVYAAAAGNLLVAITKFIAAWWTGSAAMASEAIHSLVDTGNQAVLLYGIHRAEQPPDETHPLGYGRELYFWSFIVALLMFSLGAGLSFYEGVVHLRHPVEIRNPEVSYIVLACAAIFEGCTWTIAFRQFRSSKGRFGYFEAMRRSKDPPSFIVLFEDSAAILGLAIAFIGTFSAQMFSMPRLDGAASVAISILLALTALALARESKNLLIGEPASRELRRAILSIVRSADGIDDAQLVLTVHLAPDQVVAILGVDFHDKLTVPEVEAVTRSLEHSIRDAHPEVIAIFIRPHAAAASGQMPPVGTPTRKLLGKLSDRSREISSSSVRAK